MTLEQTRQKWYNEDILHLITISLWLDAHLYTLKKYLENQQKLDAVVKYQYMKAKMEQQLKKGKK